MENTSGIWLYLLFQVLARGLTFHNFIISWRFYRRMVNNIFIWNSLQISSLEIRFFSIFIFIFKPINAFLILYFPNIYKLQILSRNPHIRSVEQENKRNKKPILCAWKWNQKIICNRKWMCNQKPRVITQEKTSVIQTRP